MRLALENRLLFDGAVVATAAQVVDDKAAQDQAQDVNKDVSVDTAPDAIIDAAHIPAAFGDLMDTKNVEQQPQAITAAASAGSKDAPTLIVIDLRAEGSGELLKNPPPNTDVRALDTNLDGYQQIADILQERGDTTDLQIITADIDGKQWLGASQITSSLSAASSDSLIDWGDGLFADTNIVFHSQDPINNTWLDHVNALTGGKVSSTQDNVQATVNPEPAEGQESTVHPELVEGQNPTTQDNADTTKNSTTTTDDTTPAAVAADTARPVTSLVFIDTSVADYKTLLNGIDPTATVILLDPAKDGVEQIAQAVSQYDNIQAIHIISHGSAGQLNLGSAVLNQATMYGQYADELAGVGGRLSTNADILIYGCNFGQGDLGLQATNTLAALTGADVADSTNNTGAAALGGDWVLERHTGSIEASVIVDVRAQVDYQGILAALNIVANTNPTVTAPTGTTLSGGNTITPGTATIVGATARYANVGTIAGVGQVDLKATVTGVAAGDTNDAIVFTRNGTQPEIQLDGKANGSKVTVHWELLVTGTSTPVTADISIAVSDIDGPTLEAVAASTQFGLTSYTSDAATHLTITTVNNQVNAVGTQNENSGPLSAIKFNWVNVSSVDFVYTTSVSGSRFFDHNGDNTLTFTTPVTTTLTALDLDGNNSTATGNDYQNTFIENGVPVKIVDTDITVTSPPSQFTGGTITLTNAQAGDQLLVGGSAGASGTLAGGISWSRSGNTISLSGTTTPANYLTALQAITFNNTSDDPSPLDRAIQVGLFNGSAFTNVPVATIHVTPINDPPVNTVPGTQTISEDIQTAITGLSVNDPETTAPLGALATVKLTVASGTLNVTAGGATISAGANNSATLTLSGTQAQINAALVTLKYQGTSNFNGTDTLTVLSTDSLGLTDTDTVTINVTPVNDAPSPVGTPFARTSVDSAAATYNFAGFFSDPEGDVLTFSATGLPPGLSINPTTGFISGTLTSNASQGGVGGVYAVSVTAKDPSNATLTRTFNWTVTNPAPTASNDSFTTLEDIPVVINVLANDNDPDGDTLAVTAINGTAIAINGTVNVTNGVVKRNADNTLTFTPASNYSGAISFQYTANDNQGGIVTATVNGTVTSVNDAPVGTDKTVTINEDSAYIVTAADFGFTDPNDSPANTLANVIVTSLPSASEGVYKLNGIAITINQVISVADINSNLLTFTPTSNINGTSLGALGFRVQDNGGTANGGADTDASPNILQFNITPVDDVITLSNLTDGTVAGTDTQVKESDLTIGSTPTATGETTTGSFTLGPSSALAVTGTALSINGTNITKTALTATTVGSPITVTGSNGTLSITGYNATSGVVSYSYTLTSAANHTGNITVNDTFSLVTTDVEAQTSNSALAINILDDTPIAVADVDEVINFPGSPASTASGNVVTGIGGTDPNNADGNADKIGADTNASPVTGVVAGTGAVTTGVGIGVPLTSVNGYGSLTLSNNGSYTYLPNYLNAAVAALSPGQTVTDTYAYQVTDGDGDTATTTLTITIVGVPAVVGLNDGSVAGTDGSVLESDLTGVLMQWAMAKCSMAAFNWFHLRMGLLHLLLLALLLHKQNF